MLPFILLHLLKTACLIIAFVMMKIEKIANAIIILFAYNEYPHIPYITDISVYTHVYDYFRIFVNFLGPLK